MPERIKKCLIGAIYKDEISELNELGIETIPVSGTNDLDEEIRYHADILAFNPYNGDFIIAEGTQKGIEADLTGFNVILEKSIASPYPRDIRLNAVLLGSKIICNSEYVSDNIKGSLKSAEILHTNQGYTKCNICIVTDNAVITEDSNIASLLNNSQIEVLKISPGYVKLSSKHHGFVGGASAKISDNEIYFSGDLSKHPDYKRIIMFLDKYNFKPVFNSNRPLNDFGGLVVLSDRNF